MWYYNDGTNKPNGPHSEETVRQLINQHVINSTTQVWQEGMAQWCAAQESGLRDAFGLSKLASMEGGTSVSSNQNFAAVPQEYVYRDISSLGFWLQLFLAFDMVVTLVTTALSSVIVELLGLSGGGVPRIDLSPGMMGKFLAMTGFGALAGIIGLVTIVLFVIWCYRANANARALGATGMTYTPGWSVGWWFIPFANLIVPYFVVKEFYKAGKNPSNWQTKECDMIVHVWFGSWLGSILIGWVVGCYVAFQAFPFSDGSQIMAPSAYINIPSVMLQVAAGIAAILMIGRLSAYQRASAAVRIPGQSL